MLFLSKAMVTANCISKNPGLPLEAAFGFMLEKSDIPEDYIEKSIKVLAKAATAPRIFKYQSDFLQYIMKNFTDNPDFRITLAPKDKAEVVTIDDFNTYYEGSISIDSKNISRYLDSLLDENEEAADLPFVLTLPGVGAINCVSRSFKDFDKIASSLRATAPENMGNTMYFANVISALAYREGQVSLDKFSTSDLAELNFTGFFMNAAIERINSFTESNFESLFKNFF